MSIFTCHKYGIIAQPFFVFQTEIIELFQQEFVRCVMEGLESLFKQNVLVVQYSTVIDFRCIKLRDRIEIVLCDQFQINQDIRVISRDCPAKAESSDKENRRNRSVQAAEPAINSDQKLSESR